MAPWIARAIYWPTLGWNCLLGRALKIRNWWDSVTPQVILGAVPLKSDVPKLHQLGVTGVVNMCEEYAGPQQAYDALGIEQLWLPTTDFQHPSKEFVRQGAVFIQQKVESGGKVYVHCKAGRARSATVVLWWLVRYQDKSPEQAQKILLAGRPHVNAHVYQRPVIVELNNELRRQAAES